jgi:hypothetical protein
MDGRFEIDSLKRRAMGTVLFLLPQTAIHAETDLYKEGQVNDLYINLNKE